MLNYAVDFDGDDRVDLANSNADVIGSVAHFRRARLAARHGDALCDRPACRDHRRALLLVPDIVPSFSPTQMAERGARLDEAVARGSLALIELLNAEAPPTYVAGTQNFYALTRYNASSYYALAVIELGRAVAAAH